MASKVLASAKVATLYVRDVPERLYKRLRAAGKEHKVAVVACARKLLIFANAVVARGTPWEVRTIAH